YARVSSASPSARRALPEHDPPMQPLASLEYEFTDDLLERAAGSYVLAMSACKPVEYPKQLPTVVGLLAMAAAGFAVLLNQGVPIVAPRLLLLASVMPEEVQELLRRKAGEVGAKVAQESHEQNAEG